MSVQFVADAMLGKLARWLRIIGYDTLYEPQADDAKLVRLARAQNRILLTRDKDLAKRRGVSVILLESEVLSGQLVQVLSLYPSAGIPRCPACNAPLADVTKQEAWGNVPLYVFAENDIFSRCTGCGKYYWPGTQWRRIQMVLEEVTAHLDIPHTCYYNNTSSM